MTDYFGVSAGKYLDPSVAPQSRSAIGGGDLLGTVRCIYDERTLPAGVLINDRLIISRLTKGQRVLQMSVICGALGAGATLDVGTDTAAATFGAAVDVAAAGAKACTGAGLGAAITADGLLVATFKGANPAAVKLAIMALLTQV